MRNKIGDKKNMNKKNKIKQAEEYAIKKTKEMFDWSQLVEINVLESETEFTEHFSHVTVEVNNTIIFNVSIPKEVQQIHARGYRRFHLRFVFKKNNILED